MLVPGAIRCFLRQDHAARKLLILDDGADPVRDLVPDDPRIRYVHLDGPRSRSRTSTLLRRISASRSRRRTRLEQREPPALVEALPVTF